MSWTARLGQPAGVDSIAPFKRKTKVFFFISQFHQFTGIISKLSVLNELISELI